MIISIKDPETWRTINGLRESIKWYKMNNSEGKYSSALTKYEKWYKGYWDKLELSQ